MKELSHDIIIKWAKIIAALLVLIGAIKTIWKFCKNVYNYVEESDIRSEKLKYIEASNNLIMRRFHMATWFCDMEGNASQISDAVCDVLKTSHSNLEKKGWLNFVANKDKERVFNEMKHHSENKLDFTGEWETIHGESVMIEMRCISNGYLGYLEVKK